MSAHGKPLKVCEVERTAGDHYKEFRTFARCQMQTRAVKSLCAAPHTHTHNKKAFLRCMAPSHSFQIASQSVYGYNREDYNNNH